MSIVLRIHSIKVITSISLLLHKYYSKIANISPHLIQGKGLCECETPPSLKRPTYHRRAGGGRGRGQAKGILKLEPAHLHTDVHQVHGSVELGEGWLGGHVETVERLQRGGGRK